VLEALVALTNLTTHTQLAPFSAELYVDGKKAITTNSRGLFHFEHHQTKQGGVVAEESKEDLHGGKEIVDYGEDGLAIYKDGSKQEKKVEEAKTDKADEDDDGKWVEKFKEHTDTKPFGPASVGMDITFPDSSHVYGIPEHTSPLSLKTTSGPAAQYNEPYRMYTLDVFEYELDTPMALYGGIPMLISHNPTQTVAVFWNNPTETFIDISKESGSTGSHWISESGVVDLMFLIGPKPAQVFAQMAHLTGGTALPPMFAIGYHQCRWNYKDQKDVATVDANFEAHNMPYDVIWLDIEHTDGKRYYTWDEHLFPTPAEMINNISAHGRKMVTIVDPHMKRDDNYAFHKKATEKGYYIKNKDGGDYDGWCWPGSSSYLDFTNPEVRSWWGDQFGYDNYIGSTPDLYTWNDMNEPSVFNGPEVSMQKDCKSVDGVEHREWHNLYGMYMQRATAEGLVKRNADANSRPFVLSRAFYAGSQRWGAVWTGDNTADWDHLAISIPMLLSLGLAGLTFTGADVGGFFGNPDAELVTRWQQAAAYQPFFRGHAHHDSKRREPWVFGEPWTSRLRAATMARYQLLPYWYTLFHHAEVAGMPTMRPLWVEYPADTATFEIEDQFLAGADLLVKPIIKQGSVSTSVYFPGATTTWYDVDTYEAYAGGKSVSVSAPLEKIPVYQRSGSIISRKMRLRRSSLLMKHDPYTLTVAMDANGEAAGDIYMDDENSFDYQTKGAFRMRQLSWAANTLTSAAGEGTLPSNANYNPENTVERVIVVGVTATPSAVSITDAKGTRSTQFKFDAAKKTVVIRKPDVVMAGDWTIKLE
jgi:alpha 1,3-glucosidase